MKKEISPVVFIVVIVVVVVIVAGLLWRSSGVTKKQGVLPGEMMKKFPPQKSMQELAPGAGKLPSSGGGTAPSPQGSGGG